MKGATQLVLAADTLASGLSLMVRALAAADGSRERIEYGTYQPLSAPVPSFAHPPGAPRGPLGHLATVLDIVIGVARGH